VGYTAPNQIGTWSEIISR